MVRHISGVVVALCFFSLVLGHFSYCVPNYRRNIFFWQPLSIFFRNVNFLVNIIVRFEPTQKAHHLRTTNLEYLFHLLLRRFARANKDHVDHFGKLFNWARKNSGNVLHILRKRNAISFVCTLSSIRTKAAAKTKRIHAYPCDGNKQLLRQRQVAELRWKSASPQAICKSKLWNFTTFKTSCTFLAHLHLHSISISIHSRFLQNQTFELCQKFFWFSWILALLLYRKTVTK